MPKLVLLKMLDSSKKPLLLLEYAEYLTLNMPELPLLKKMPELQKNSCINYTLLPMESKMELPLKLLPSPTIKLLLDLHALTIKQLLFGVSITMKPLPLLLSTELPLL
jgi:hypothetical protein